jgi:hypothetical protein
MAINMVLFMLPLSSLKSEMSMLKVRFSGSFGKETFLYVEQATLQMTDLDVSLCD